jgi:hypothetical protein
VSVNRGRGVVDFDAPGAASPNDGRRAHTEGWVVIGWGIFLIVLGAGSLLLPQLGYQFTLMELLDDFQPYAGIVVAVIGAVLVFMGMNRRPATAVDVTPPRQDPPPAP